jgi:hypothetical protein
MNGLAVFAIGLLAQAIAINGDGSCVSIPGSGTGKVTCDGIDVDISKAMCASFDGNECKAVYNNNGNQEIYYIGLGGITTLWQNDNMKNCGADTSPTFPFTGVAGIQYMPNQQGYNCYFITDVQSVAQTTYTFTGSASAGITAVTATIPKTGNGRGITEIVVTCSESGAITWATVGDSANPGTYEFDVVGPCIPGGGGGGGEPAHGDPDKTEVGWILTGLLLGGGLVYFAGGTVYNQKYKGSNGKESIPNYDFWTSIPGLIKDGFGFTISIVREKISGGGEGYSSV